MFPAHRSVRLVTRERDGYELNSNVLHKLGS